MTFKLGSTDINEIRLGSTEIKKAYLGSTLIHDTTGGGGASGNFTFAMQANGTAYGDPASSALSGYADGDVIVVAVEDRGGTSHANHAVSFDGATVNGTLTKRGGYDNEIANADARTAMSVWTYDVQSGDDLGNVIGDDGTANSKRCSWFVIRPSATYGRVFKAIAFDGSGTTDWDGDDSDSTASLTGNDMLEIAIAGCRTSSDEPTSTSFNSPHTTGHTEHLGGDNTVSIVAALASPSTGEGVKSSAVNSDGTNNEGIVAILVFGDS